MIPLIAVNLTINFDFINKSLKTLSDIGSPLTATNYALMHSQVQDFTIIP